LALLKEIIYSLINEVKAILKEYLRETETALKKRLQRLLFAGLIVGVLGTLLNSINWICCFLSNYWIAQVPEYLHAGMGVLDDHGSYFSGCRRINLRGAFHLHMEAIEIIYNQANMKWQLSSLTARKIDGRLQNTAHRYRI
jgi:hypothetical protein